MRYTPLFDEVGTALLSKVVVPVVGAQATREDSEEGDEVDEEYVANRLELLQRQIARLAEERMEKKRQGENKEGQNEDDDSKENASDKNSSAEDQDSENASSQQSGTEDEESTQSDNTGSRLRGVFVDFQSILPTINKKSKRKKQSKPVDAEDNTLESTAESNAGADSNNDSTDVTAETLSWFSVYRCLLPGKGLDNVEAEISRLPESKPWAFFFLRGGHFAAAIFEKGKAIRHKSFHKYVVRAKRGTVQSTQDKKSATGQPKSAGASIRRHNETVLYQKIGELINAWKSDVDNCGLVFVQAPVRSRIVFFGNSKSPGLLDKTDSRIRPVPFATGRPNLTELVRCHSMLAAIYHHEGAENTEVQEKEVVKSKEELEQEKAEKKLKQQRDAEKAIEVQEKNAEFVDSPLYKACVANDKDEVDAIITGQRDNPGGFDINYAWNTSGETALHAASRVNGEIVKLLLEMDANPAIKDEKNRPPFVVAKDKETRNVFRRHMGEFPDQWDYALAQIPSPLTAEMEAKKEEKAKAEKKKQRERQKQRAKAKAAAEKAEAAKKEAEAEQRREEHAKKAAEEAHKRKLRSMTKAEREKYEAQERRRKCAEAALARRAASKAAAESGSASKSGCNYCGVDTKLSFARGDYKYCSPKCMSTHTLELLKK
eukprot:m.100517 g.100517  ORF g.100517 m.100517 type:complete len:658 (+) comp13711_c0_seq1:94-2067(+)